MEVVEGQLTIADGFPANLTAADTTACQAFFEQFIMNIHAQTGAFIAFDNMVGWDITDDAVDAAVAGDGGFDLNDQVD